MSVPAGDLASDACRTADERVARKLRRTIGERQLRACSSILRGMSELVGRQLRRDEAVREAGTLRQTVSEMQEDARQQADLECVQHMQHCLNAISEHPFCAVVSDDFESAFEVNEGGGVDMVEMDCAEEQLWLCLIYTADALMRRQLILTDRDNDRREKIISVGELLDQAVRKLQESTSQQTESHEDRNELQCQGHIVERCKVKKLTEATKQPGMELQDMEQQKYFLAVHEKGDVAVSLLKDKKSARAGEVESASLQPRVCRSLMGGLHALMRRKMSLAEGQVLTTEEVVEVKIESKAFRQIQQQLRDQTRQHAVMQRKEAIENDSMGHVEVDLKLAAADTEAGKVTAEIENVSAMHVSSTEMTVVRAGVCDVDRGIAAVSEGTMGNYNDSNSDICRLPTNHELRHLARLIEPQWKDVAHCLLPQPLESHHIANIECQHPQDLTNQSAVMLERWCRRHGREATVQLLCESLLDAECRLPAEKVFGEELVDRVAVESSQNVPESIEQTLFELAKSIGTEWQQLALLLDVSSVDVDCIERDISTTRERAFEMLRGWYWKHGRRAHWDEVHSKIRDIQKEKQAKETAQAIFPNNLRDDRRFYGREHELDAMKECLLGGDVHLAHVSPALKFHLLVVRGHGGIGKSSLVARFAILFKEVYRDGVFLFNAESWPTFRMSLRENIAELSVSSQGGGLDEDNKLFLSLLRQKSKVLLLYDNADDLDLITRVLPRESSQLHVVVTTRCTADHELLRQADLVIPLGYLSPDNAVVALFGWADRQCPDDRDELVYAKRLVTSLLIQGLPIAIAHMGTFVRLENMSFCDYYKQLKSEEEELKAAALDIDKLLRYFQISHLRESLAAVGVTQPSDLQSLPFEHLDDVTKKQIDKQVILTAQFWMNESKHVYLTWQFDIDAVSKKSPDAMRMLEYVALLASRNIPGDILQSVAFPDLGRRAALLFSKAIMKLSSHTLITAVETNETCTIDAHGLVQSAVFQRLIRRTHDLYLKLARLAQFLLQNMPVGQSDIKDSLNLSNFLQLIPHIYSVAEKILMTGCQNEVCCNLVVNACWTALEAHHVDIGRRLCEKQLEVVEALCNNSRDVRTVVRHVTALRQMGRAYLSLQQKPSIAQSFFSRALQLIEGVGDDGNLLLQQLYGAVLGDLAGCYQDQGQFSEAERLYLHRLSLLKSSPQSDQRSVLTAMNNLASVYEKAGQLHHAVDIYQQALCRAQSVTGTEILIGTMMGNLGRCLMEVGDSVSAVGMLEQSLSVMRRWRQGDHRDVAIVLSLLSQCHQLSGDLPKATRLAEEAVSIIRSTHDPHHSLVAVYIGQLAACCHAGGDVDRAIRLSEQRTAILRRNQPEAREDLGSALNNLGMYYDTKNMLTRAITTLEESLTLKQSFFPKLHPSVAFTLHNLGLVYKKAGDMHKAMELYKESLSIYEHILPVHVDTARVLNSLALCFVQQGLLTECVQLLLRSRHILTQVSPVSGDMGVACYSLGGCYMKLSRLKEAEEALCESVRISKAVYPAGHSEITTGEKLLRRVKQRLHGY